MRWLGKVKSNATLQSTYAAYVLILENHILSSFGDCEVLSEKLVQEFVLQKLNAGLCIKTVKDMLIVLRMVMKFGVKNGWMNYCEWDIKYPTTEGNREIEVLTVAQHKRYSISSGRTSHFATLASTSA